MAIRPSVDKTTSQNHSFIQKNYVTCWLLRQDKNSGEIEKHTLSTEK